MLLSKSLSVSYSRSTNKISYGHLSLQLGELIYANALRFERWGIFKLDSKHLFRTYPNYYGHC